MRSNHLILITLTTLLSACSSGQLLPEQERKAEYIESIPGNKNELFNRALTYLSKKVTDSNHAIKLRDDSSAKIVAHLNTPCNAVRSALYIYELDADFNLDFQAKDSKVRVAFEDIVIIDRQSNHISYMGQVDSKENFDKVVGECIKPIYSDLLKSIKTTQASW
jgi:hypothetical protein